LFRLSKHKLEKLWAEHIGSLSEHGETYKGFSGSYWSFSRQTISQSLSRLSEQDEQIALQMFQIILKYAGLGQNGNDNDNRVNTFVPRGVTAIRTTIITLECFTVESHEPKFTNYSLKKIT